MTLAFVPLYIRHLGIEAYALVGLFGLIQAWMWLLDLGMTPTLTREMARSTSGVMPPQAIRDLLRSLEYVALAIAVVAGGAIILASGYLANHWLKVEQLPITTVVEAIMLIGLVVASRFCESIYRSALIGLHQQVWFNAVNAGLSTLRYGGAALLVIFVWPSILAFFVWQLVVSLLTLGILAHRLYSSLPSPPQPARFSRAALDEVKKFAIGVLGINLLGTLLMQVDKVLLSRFLPLEAFGHYMIATSICGMLMLIVFPVTQAIGPVLVQRMAAHDANGLERDYHLGAQLIAVIVVPVAVMMVLFARDMLYAWSGDAALARDVAPVLALLVLGTLLNALIQLPNVAMLAFGSTRIQLWVNAVAVVVMIPLLFLVVPQFGPTGAASVWLLVNIGYVLVELPLIHRQILHGQLWPLYRDAMLLPALAATVAGLACLQLRAHIELDRIELILYLAVAGVVCMAAAAMAAPAVRGRVTAELMRLRTYGSRQQ